MTFTKGLMQHLNADTFLNTEATQLLIDLLNDLWSYVLKTFALHKY